MRDSKKWAGLYHSITVTQVVAVVGIVLFSASQNFDAEWVEGHIPVVHSWVVFLQDWNRVFTPILVGFVTGTIWAKTLIGSPTRWRTFRQVLSVFRDSVYTEKDQDEVHQNRITLFQHQRCCLRWRCCWCFWGGWLVPLVRTGHTTQSKSAIFRAPDRPEHAKNRRGSPRRAADVQKGVAGIAWYKEKVYMVANLPDVSGTPTEDELKLYSKKTGVSVEWLKERKPAARSYCGIPIEVNGKRAGVIVLDSHNPKGIRESGPMKKNYELLGRVVRTLW